VPNGHLAETDTSDARFTLSAADKWSLVPAVGRNGNGVPLQTFDELLRGVGSDGTRAHHMTQSCTP
jgi:hypothetical protein